jgi:hypothetical protein
LDEHIGDFIIGLYIQDRSSKEIIWNMNTSILAYAVKGIIDDEKKNWEVTKNCSDIDNYVITPFINYMFDRLKRCIFKMWNNRTNYTYRQKEEIMNVMIISIDIQKSVETGALKYRIIDHLAAYFCSIK